jgi:hypothetical protein
MIEGDLWLSRKRRRTFHQPDHETGRLLGAQLLGHKGSEVSKRVDVFASARKSLK